MIKVLQFRYVNGGEWQDYQNDFETVPLEPFEIGRVYPYEFRVIEREKKDD